MPLDFLRPEAVSLPQHQAVLSEAQPDAPCSPWVAHCPGQTKNLSLKGPCFSLYSFQHSKEQELEECPVEAHYTCDNFA